MRRFSPLAYMVLFLSACLLLFSSRYDALAQDAEDSVVRAVLFFSPSCGHCQKVVNDVLPPLTQQYGDRLLIMMVDVSQAGGAQFYRTAVEALNIPKNRWGVPTLVVGDQVLVGSFEIPERFPGLIEQYLAQGGLGWPAIPGVEAWAAQLEPTPVPTPSVTATLVPSAVAEPTRLLATSTATAVPPFLLTHESSQKLLDNFLNDQPANTLALVVLAGMVLAVATIPFTLARPLLRPPHRWSDWLIPLLTLAGLVVAAYLTYVEARQLTAVCGPIGDCNLVHQSPYSRVGGVLPVGLLGLGGYVGILAAWLISRLQHGQLAKLAAAGLLGMALFGTLFSILLTFLETFVIGATCMWCLVSAVLITAIFILSIPYYWQVQQAMHSNI